MIGSHPKTFYAAKKLIIISNSDGFLHNILRDFWFFSKIKNGPLSGPIYHQIQYRVKKKAYATMSRMEKLKKSSSQIFYFWNFITHLLKWSEEHFSKSQNMWINENLSTRSANLPVLFLLEGISGHMEICLLLNISVQGGLNLFGDFF
jgi:hypothetical protein